MTGIYDANVKNTREKAIEALTTIATLQQLATSTIMHKESSLDHLSYPSENALRELKFLKEQLEMASRECRANLNFLLQHGSHNERNATPRPDMEAHRTNPFSEYDDRALFMEAWDMGTMPPDSIALLHLRIEEVILAAEELIAIDGGCCKECALETIELVRGLLNSVSSECLERIGATINKISHR